MSSGAAGLQPIASSAGAAGTAAMTATTTTAADSTTANTATSRREMIHDSWKSPAPLDGVDRYSSTGDSSTIDSLDSEDDIDSFASEDEEDYPSGSSEYETASHRNNHRRRHNRDNYRIRDSFDNRGRSNPSRSASVSRKDGKRVNASNINQQASAAAGSSSSSSIASPIAIIQPSASSPNTMIPRVNSSTPSITTIGGSPHRNRRRESSRSRTRRPHRAGSRRSSPDGSISWNESSSVEYAKHSLMVEHLYKACRSKGWLDTNDDEGAVSLRVSSNLTAGGPPPPLPGMGGQLEVSISGSGRPQSVISTRSTAPVFVTYPEPNNEFARAVRGLNVEVAIILTSKMIRSAIEMVPETNTDLRLRDGTKMQVLETLSRLPRARKLQYAALIRQEQALVVWSQSVDTIIESAEAVQEQLVKVVWSGLPQPIDGEEEYQTTEPIEPENPKEAARAKKRLAHGRTRPIYFIWPIISTLSICVTIIFFGQGIATLVRESLIDGNWYRMAFIALLPLQILFTQFVPQAALSCIMQIVGPIKQLEGNSQFYSGVPPKRMERAALPHITIQMPVYTESLDGVLDPTIQSLQKAISTYESQGGTASIFVNEDGMQVIPEHEAELRRRYYAEHNIGWCSRPKHNPKGGFIRKGRFKKASNMNFCLMISRNLEIMLDTHPELTYDEALERVLQEDGRAWAAGDIQMGDIILIVDSDTRVPEDCLLDAASEFLESPEVAIIQHSASPMLVTFNYFELGIAFFTKIIYASIRYCCASGETSPFVGHNAFLRWSAIKEVGFEEDGVVKYWSESHVSEDFDMSLRLQIRGYCIRYAAYCGDGFQEGVSLSVYDEVGRWQKYSYGCSELVFHPVKDWLCKGLITPLFWRFLFSNMNLYSKINIIGYIGSYYAIAAAWILTLVNYFVLGFFDDSVDVFYLPSFDVLVTTVCVFTVLSNISFAVFRYRLKEANFFWAVWENLCWFPFFCCFFSGLSFHCSLALLSHMFGYNMTWGTTAKELENSNFFKEVPKVLGGYKRMYIIFLLLTAMLPIMVYVPPPEWTITGFTLLLPASLVFGGHLLLPIALNPSLMTFSF